MSPITVSILFIRLLTLQVHKFTAPAESSRPDMGSCIYERRSPSDLRYICNDHNNTIIVNERLESPVPYVSTIFISCEVNNSISGAWFKLLKGIEISDYNNWVEVCIDGCPLPEKPIQDILLELKRKKVNKLDLSLVYNFEQRRYLAQHFRGLEYKEAYLDTKENKVTTLPKDLLIGLPDLESLNLMENNLSKLETGTFEHVLRLKSLMLKCNNIITLDQHIFQNLSNLQSLHLGFNKISELPGDIFEKTVELRILNINGNLLRTLPAVLFQTLTKLETIDLSDNKLKILPAILFQTLTNIVKIKLGNNELTTLPDALFQKLTNINEIDLTNNTLTILPDMLFQSLTNIRIIYLSYNQLTTLQDTLFQALTNINQIDLKNNNLTTLPDMLFQNLRNIKIINLRYNKLTTLPVVLFQELTEINEIDLGNNHLRTLPGTLFQNLRNIKMIDLSYNKLKTLPDVLFQTLTNIDKIDLRNNTLRTLPDMLFQNLTDIKIIDLSYNKLTTLPGTLFWEPINIQEVTSMLDYTMLTLPGASGGAVYFTNIKMIDLRNNKLTVLNETLFHGMKHLHTVDLGSNKLISIPKNAFRDLDSLINLHLENNNISHFEDGTFDSLQKLEFINLNNNRFLSMERSKESKSSVLRSCLNLNTIFLQNNSVNRIFEDWKLFLQELKLLDLSHNKLENLTVCDFQFSQRTDVEVILDNNRISLTDLHTRDCIQEINHRVHPNRLKVSLRKSIINCDCPNYDFIRFARGQIYLPALEQVQLQNKDELQCVQPAAMSNNATIANFNLADLSCPTDKCSENCLCRFYPANNVTEVDCSNVTELPTWLPNSTKVWLNLSRNKLIDLTKVSTLINSQVTNLSLSWNALKYVDDLRIFPQLKKLDLDHNNITSFGKDFLEALNQGNVEVTLHENPLTCDCTAKHLLGFIERRISQSSNIPNIEDITCEKTGIPLKELSVDDICSVVYIYYSVISILGVLFGALAIFYMRYEQDIKALMFKHKICLCLVSEEEVDRDKEFDAFISYCHKDEDFIVNHLVPNLEKGDDPYKLCLHYRDWMVGGHIPEQIVKSVGSSRRTVIVLSKNYLKSRWANVEFRTAYLQALKERHARVIVILLEDLDMDKMLDSELKTYVTMNTYLKWDDSLFWTKLRYALPHPQR